MGRTYTQHGSRHGPNGSDPILGSAPMYPTFYNVPFYDDSLIYMNSALSKYDRIGRRKIDSTVPGNMVINNYDDSAYTGGGTRTAAIEDALVVPVRIGPATTRWGINLGYKSGTDFGTLKFSYAGPMGEGTYGNDPPLWALEGLDDVVDELNGLSWVDYFETLDCYSSGGEFWNTGGIFGDFRIMGGSSAAKLSAFTTPSYSDDPFARRHGDGGPGVYWIKLEVAGKNGASSGYKVALTSMTVSVFDDWGLSDL